MFELTIRDVVEATKAQFLSEAAGGELDRELLESVATSVVTDSRQVCEGSIFLCIKGERVDGNEYAQAAVEAGAAAVVLTTPLVGGQPNMHPNMLCGIARQRHCALLRADGDDAEEFLLRLAGAWRSRNPQWVVVGVTGSVGKTTTKDMLAAGLSVAGRVHATAGNHNNLIGMSLTLLSASADDEYVVCEMGMDHAGELTRLSAAARPDVALITNVGTSHIGNLGSREAIARAKAEIVSGMRPTKADDAKVASCLVITSDNDFGALIEGEYARPAGVEVVRVGTKANDVVRLGPATIDDLGHPSATVTFADGLELPVTLDMPGAHVLVDLVLALGIIGRLGADRAEALEAIAHMPRTAMRLEVKKVDGRPRVIDDSYNASPNSMAGALDVLAAMACEGRRIAVLGEIGELGDDSERLHGYVGAYAAAKNPDLLVFVGTEAARQMAEAARTMGFSDDRLEVFESGAEALAVLAPVFDEKDLVLVKASRFMGLDAFAKGVLS